MSLDLDGYHYSETDIRRTVAEAVALLDEYGEHDPAVVALLGARRSLLLDLVGDLPAWKAPIGDVSALLPEAWSTIRGARDDLAAAGLLPTCADGAVAHLHLGGGGVPKPSVDAVDVDLGGVVGDRQGTRRHHGAPWQALCLWSDEVIASLVADGHPIAHGFAGENVTIRDVPWEHVRPGVRLSIGDVRCEISSYAVPCKQNTPWFSDGDFTRIHHRHGPISRMYATVLTPGRITVGDPVVVEP